MRTLVLSLAGLISGCSAAPWQAVPAAAPETAACAPLRQVPTDWVTVGIETPERIRLRLPASATLDSSGQYFDIPGPTVLGGGSIGLARTQRDSVYYIDGVPVLPGPGGGRSSAAARSWSVENQHC